VLGVPVSAGFMPRADSQALFVCWRLLLVEQAPYRLVRGFFYGIGVDGLGGFGYSGLRMRPTPMAEDSLQAGRAHERFFARRAG